MTEHHSYDPPAPAVEPAVPRVATPMARIGRLLTLWACCLAIGVAAQFVTVLNDNSVRNLISLIAAGVAFVGTLIWTYRTLAAATFRSLAVVVTLALLLLPVGLFRIRGFSGEMIPQVELRFTAAKSLRVDPLRDAAGGAESEPVAETDFPEFLGSGRDGVIASRDFAVPDVAAPELIWRGGVGEGWSGFAIAGYRCVTLEQRGDEECVSCYRLSDGELLWIHRERARHENRLGGIGPRSTPTIVGDRVYTQGATGIVNCLDLETGESIWRQDLMRLVGWTQSQSEQSIIWGRAGSPLLVEGLCVLPLGGPESMPQLTNVGEGNDDLAVDEPVVAGGGRGLIALDAVDGTIRWTAGSDQISYASPIRMSLAGVDQIVIVNENSVSGHAIDDGQMLWQTAWPGSSSGSANCAAAIRVDESALLVGKAYGTGSAVFEIEPATADSSDRIETEEKAAGRDFSVATRWQSSRVLKTKFTHACVRDGFAYGLSDGTLECVDLEDGQRMWAQSRGNRYGHGQLLLVEDVLVVQTEAGDVAWVEARSDRFVELAVTPALTSKTWNIPAIAGRYLLVRNDSEAVCFRLSDRGDVGSEPSADDAESDGRDSGVAE